MTPREAWLRILEAVDVMQRLPSIDWPAGYRSSMPDIVRAASALYALSGDVTVAAPRGAEIDRAWEVMDWLSCLERRDQQIVWARATGAAWWKLSQRYNKSVRQLQRWFNDALERMVVHKT